MQHLPSLLQKHRNNIHTNTTASRASYLSNNGKLNVHFKSKFPPFLQEKPWATPIETEMDTTPNPLDPFGCFIGPSAHEPWAICSMLRCLEPSLHASRNVRHRVLRVPRLATRSAPRSSQAAGPGERLDEAHRAHENWMNWNHVSVHRPWLRRFAFG